MAQNQPPKNNTREYYVLGLKILGDFGITIAVPVVVFAMIGQYLDRHHPLGNWPWYTIIGFLLAAALTARIIYKKAKHYGKIYENIDKENIDKKD